MSKYWDISVREMLSDMGLDAILTEEQTVELVENVQAIANLEWEATGQQFIPDPRDETIKELEAKVKEYSRDKDNIIGAFSHIVGTSVYFNEHRKEVEVL